MRHCHDLKARFMHCSELLDSALLFCSQSMQGVSRKDKETKAERTKRGSIQTHEYNYL